MYKGRINKKTAIIAVLLIFATIISVFAISNAIQASKAATNANISPYKYGLVVAYYGYWKTGNSYFADVDYSGQRKNIGQVPSEYAEFDLTFPTTLIEGNYEIDSIIDFRNYTGSWDDLNYHNMPYNEVKDHYIEYASIWNPQAYIGEKNTEVTFTASFRLLNPPDQGLPGSKFAKDMSNGVYKCYIAVVVKYVDSDFVKDPDKWWEEHGGNLDDPDPDPGTGDVMVYVWHKEKGTDKNLSDLQKVRTSMGSNLVLSGKSIDGYKCISSKIKGLTTKNYETNYINEVVGRYDYSTPDDGYMDVTFYYEKGEEKPSDNWCDPQFDANSKDARIKMKRFDFEKADEIYFSNVYIYLDDFEGGWKRKSATQGEKIPGQHNFSYFDLYLKYPGSSSYDFIRTDIYSKGVYQSINIPKSKFTSTNPENTEYVASVEATLGVSCSCGGFGAEKTNFNLYVDIEENQPPNAYFKYATKKILPSGTESGEYGKAYINKDIVIYNYASDPNGLTDIDYTRFIFKNNVSNQVKNIQLKMMPWGEYKLDEADSFANTSIIFNGAEENGNLNLQFTTDEEWEVSLYVQDTEGLNDIYTEVIKPEVLSLKPTAIIRDTRIYRFPSIINEFNGKQNRVIKIDSNDSYVASWIRDMDVEIDHSQDMWQIEPVDGQNVQSIKLEKEEINKYLDGNILNVRYEKLDMKMMFKEPGRYKIRLQVTDTDGNASDWSEQVITIHEDLLPEATGNIESKYYRNSSGIATLYLSSLNAITKDYDIANVYYVGYKHDSNNDGSFDDETWKEIEYRNPVILQTSNLGKYQFIVKVKEEFGQETLQKYIIEEDIKKTYILFFTEVDNIAPNVSKFKIMHMEE